MSELTTLFKNTADATRSKTGDTATMQASQFPAKIQGISVGISQDEADARYLQLSGGTMTGNLILNGAPTADNQAATKAYVDGKAGGGLQLFSGNVDLPSERNALIAKSVTGITTDGYGPFSRLKFEWSALGKSNESVYFGEADNTTVRGSYMRKSASVCRVTFYIPIQRVDTVWESTLYRFKCYSLSEHVLYNSGTGAINFSYRNNSAITISGTLTITLE